ncbi:MAG: sialidase family protein [Actinomycetota bacterium]
MKRSFAGVAIALLLSSALVGGMTSTSAASSGVDSRVSVGSPATPFAENKQNEPALAVDAHDPSVLAAGSNDEIDLEACNSGDDTKCPFTPGIGVSGVYFSTNTGDSWTQPTYQGLTARNCQGAPGNSDPECTPQVGPIGTLPRYYENKLVSDGDPALAFGPRRGTNGKFDWDNGSRLYYANLTANLNTARDDLAFKGFEGIAVSRTDDRGATWKDPVVVSKQSSTTFSDKEQIWADNATSSRYFGNVYLCWASFRGQEKGNAAPAPLIVAVSSDGGDTWTQHQLTAAANNGQRNPMDGCTVRTDSTGNAYVFGVGTDSSQSHQAFEVMSVSKDGGKIWSQPKPVAGPVTQPGVTDPVQGRPVIDGEAGARSDLAPAPSVDIANGAPSGSDATNRIVMTYVSGDITHPHVYFTESSNLGQTWSAPSPIESAGDRGYYTAPAISPNGRDVYVVYNAFTTPYRNDTTTPRSLVGVVLHANVSGVGTGSFSELHRGTPGDPRGSSANALTDEFLGDYVYAVATRTYGAAVWNDMRNGADCPAIDAWRHGLQTADTSDDVPRPAPQQDCPANFGNSDIYGGSFPDPTP